MNGTIPKNIVKRKHFTKRQKNSLIGIAFVLPCMIVLLFMMVRPVFQTFYYSVSSIKLPYFETKFVGLDNFIRMLAKPELGVAVKNTIIWTIFLVMFRMLMGLGTALVMNANIKGIKILRLIALLPWTVPSIVSSNIWRWIFQSDFGLLNGQLRAWGLDSLAKTWLGSSSTALGSVLVAATWAGYPFVMMMIISRLQGLSKEPYEAAMIDGANKWQLFRYITIPGLKPVLYVVFILETISAMNSFDMIKVMTGGGPGGSSEILGLFIYRIGFTNFDFGGASAVSVMLILVVILVFLLYGPTQMKKSKLK